MTSRRSVLHLVRGDDLPEELRDAPGGDTVVFLGGLPAAPFPRCRLVILGPGAGPATGIGHDELLDLIFECDSAVTW